MFLISLTEPLRETFINLAYHLVGSNGEMSRADRLMIQETRREMNLTDNLKPHQIDTKGIQQIFDSRRSRIIALICLIRLNYSDSGFDIEKNVLSKISAESLKYLVLN